MRKFFGMVACSGEAEYMKKKRIRLVSNPLWIFFFIQSVMENCSFTSLLRFFHAEGVSHETHGDQLDKLAG